MFYKIHNYYKILSFNKNKYEEVIDNIIKSRSFVCYINSKDYDGWENPRYYKYLNDKQAMYTCNISADTSENSIVTTILPEEVGMDKINDLYTKYGINDDFFYDKNLVEADKDSPTFMYTFIHEIKLIEQYLVDRCLNIDEHLETIDRKYLRGDFIFNRFLMIPFLAKYNDQYIEPIIIMNVYKEGIITLQTIISYDIKNNIDLFDGEPMNIQFDDASFYKIKEEYKTKDFWEKTKDKCCDLDAIFNYYIKLLEKTSKESFYTDRNFSQYAIIVSELLDKPSIKSSGSFLESNKKTTYSYLHNASKKIVDREIYSNIEKDLSKHLVWATKATKTYCNPTSLVHLIDNSLHHELAVEALKDEETDLKKEGIYKENLINVKKEIIYMHMFDVIRFYELTFIKKFYTQKMLIDLLNKNYKTLQEYNSLKKNLYYIKVKFDEDSLFQTEGSPKKLYENLLLHSNTNYLLEKVENLVRNIADDIKDQNDLEIEKTNKRISLFISLLTVFVSFEPIHYLTNYFFNGKPGLAIAIWGIFIVIIICLFLNYNEQD